MLDQAQLAKVVDLLEGRLGLEALREVVGKRFHRGVLLYAGREVLPFGKEMWAVPMAGVWQMSGRTNRRP